jgi:hypothetical protein
MAEEDRMICDKCGHRWDLHDGCCQWREGEAFCLCLEEQPDERPRKLTRMERLEAMADAGIDTWEGFSLVED